MAETTRNESATFTDSFCYSDVGLLIYFQMVDSIIPYVVNSTLNGLLAIVATVANVLVFAAVRHTNSIRLPSKILLLSLIVTDLGIGLVAQPQFVVFLIARLNGAINVSCFCFTSSGFVGSMLTCVSLLTITAISVDRYIAFFFHVRYQEIVTSRRIVAVIVFIWLFGVFFSSSVYWNDVFFEYTSLSWFTVCFLVISVAYVKIYRGLRNQHGFQEQRQPQGNVQQETGNRLNVAKYRRSVSSMLWIYGLYIFCYSPFICMSFVTTFFWNDVVTVCIFEFAGTVLFLNSCLNPFVYFFRLPEIRAKVQQRLRKLCS